MDNSDERVKFLNDIIRLQKEEISELKMETALLEGRISALEEELGVPTVVHLCLVKEG